MMKRGLLYLMQCAANYWTLEMTWTGDAILKLFFTSIKNSRGKGSAQELTPNNVNSPKMKHSRHEDNAQGPYRRIILPTFEGNWCINESVPQNHDTNRKNSKSSRGSIIDNIASKILRLRILRGPDRMILRVNPPPLRWNQLTIAWRGCHRKRFKNPSTG